MNLLQTSVQEVEGIGPAYREKLGLSGIHDLADLLSVSSAVLAENSGLSQDQIEKWQAAAMFMEAGSMTAQWAEATVHAGILSFDEWLDMSLDHLQSLFSEAVEAGRIPLAPTTSDLLEVTKDVSRLYLGKKAEGQVADHDGNPVAGAQVLAGLHSTTTDERGRWRIAGMNSNDAVRLFIIADGYATYHDPAFQLTTGTRTISVSRITVQPGISEPFLVDELFGDPLPPLQGYRSTVRVYDENEVRENEILSVSSYYDNGDVRMVSEYLSMENNLLIIRAYRLSANKLSDGAAINSLWRFSQGVFLYLSDSRNALNLYKHMRHQLPEIDPSGMSRDEVLMAFQPHVFSDLSNDEA